MILGVLPTVVPQGGTWTISLRFEARLIHFFPVLSYISQNDFEKRNRSPGTGNSYGNSYGFLMFLARIALECILAQLCSNFAQRDPGWKGFWALTKSSRDERTLKPKADKHGDSVVILVENCKKCQFFTSYKQITVYGWLFQKDVGFASLKMAWLCNMVLKKPYFSGLKPPMVAIQWSGSSWLPALKEIGISQDSLDTIVIQWFIGICNNHYKDPYCGWDDHQPYSEYWPWLICPYVPPHFWMNLIMTSHRDVTGMMLSFHDHPKWPKLRLRKTSKGRLVNYFNSAKKKKKWFIMFH